MSKGLQAYLIVKMCGAGYSIKEYENFCKIVENELKALEIIRKKKVNLQTFDIIIKQDWSFENYENEENDKNTSGQQFSNKRLTEEEFNLLKEVLKNDNIK